MFKPIKAIKHEHGRICIIIKKYPFGIYVNKDKSYEAYATLSIACSKSNFYISLLETINIHNKFIEEYKSTNNIIYNFLKKFLKDEE